MEEKHTQLPESTPVALSCDWSNALLFQSQLFAAMMESLSERNREQ